MGIEKLLYDVSPEALENGRKVAAHIASWGTPARCKTGSTGMMGECLLCGDDQGEHSPRCDLLRNQEGNGDG